MVVLWNCLFCILQGHLLLIGVSGAGKTTLSRFVAWINGLSVYQIKVQNCYTLVSNTTETEEIRVDTILIFTLYMYT